jgi:predicted lipoprotein with Yx(FWY)xxD motif
MSIRRSLIVMSVFALLLAACSSDDDGGGDTGATGANSPTETESSSPPASESPTTGGGGSGGGETEVEAEDSPLGTILTDADGNTLYVFFADTDGSSTCYDDCATSWPAFVTSGELKAGGGGDIDESLLGTTARDDGTTQVTFNDQPLYYFSGDAAPGDTNGQAVGDVWYVVAPSGDAITG